MRDAIVHSTAFYQLGALLGGILFSALAMMVMDAFVDAIQTRVLAIASEERREPNSDDIVTLASTQCVKHVIVLLFAGGLCLWIELHRWDNLVSTVVLFALFGRNIYLVIDAVSCLMAPSRLPRGLPKSVMPDYRR